MFTLFSNNFCIIQNINAEYDKMWFPYNKYYFRDIIADILQIDINLISLYIFIY